MKSYISEVLKRIWADIKKYKIGIIICIVYYASTVNIFGASCPFILVTGLPCPGCGLTRSLVNICTGHFARAFTTNPASYAWFVMIVLFVVTRYFLGKKPKYMYWILTAVAIITITVYLYGMIKYFPNRIPYVYTSKNLFRFIHSHLH